MEITIEEVCLLRENTGCSKKHCKDALIYSNGDAKLAIAYLKAMNLAVATPGLTFNERVMYFFTND